MLTSELHYHEHEKSSCGGHTENAHLALRCILQLNLPQAVHTCVLAPLLLRTVTSAMLVHNSAQNGALIIIVLSFQTNHMATVLLPCDSWLLICRHAQKHKSVSGFKTACPLHYEHCT